jgi:thioredoxin reductase
MSDFIPLRPYDEFNRELEANVHPPDWINPAPSGRYNLVVVGAGTAGLVMAAGAAGLGAKVALIERELLGGDCLNVGCVPSKALLSAAKRVAAIRRVGEFGVRINGAGEVDFATAMARMRRLRADISPHDSAARFRALGVDVFFGQGAFTGPDRIEVGGKTLEFKRAVIATGARSAAPPIPGLDQIEYLTNESVFSLTELPKRLAVIGAGPIGCEMAQTFARFGSNVLLVEAMHGALPNEETDASRIVLESLKRDALDRFAQLAPAYELILGSRTGRKARGGMTPPQRLCNWLAPILIYLIWRHRFRDLGPQRAIRVDAYRRLKMRDRSYGWTVEMQVRAVEEGLRIAEIPVRSFPRAAGSSKISGTLRGTLLAGIVILRTIAELAWRGTRSRKAGDRLEEQLEFLVHHTCQRGKDKRMPETE